jgi:hypothetical protein
MILYVVDGGCYSGCRSDTVSCKQRVIFPSYEPQIGLLSGSLIVCLIFSEHKLTDNI